MREGGKGGEGGRGAGREESLRVAGMHTCRTGRPESS